MVSLSLPPKGIHGSKKSSDFVQADGAPLATLHFANETAAITYRSKHGLGGWVFVYEIDGTADLFPATWTPTRVLNKVAAVTGRLVGSGKIEPHAAFTVVSPDQVAECWEGISEELYGALWAVVGAYPKGRSEVNDDFEDRCVAKFWDRFSVAEQIELNEAAEADEAKWG